MNRWHDWWQQAQRDLAHGERSTRKEAQNALDDARIVLEFCRGQVSG